MSSPALVAIQPLADAPVLVDSRLFRLKQMMVDVVTADDSQEIVHKLRSEMEILRKELADENKTFRPAGRQGSFPFQQFCNGPLQNWYFNINREVGWQ